MNGRPKAALISEELLDELIALLPSETQARIVVARDKDNNLVTALWSDGCKCCEGPR